MASIKFTALVSSMAGTYNGSVLQRGRATPVIKNSPPKQKPSMRNGTAVNSSFIHITVQIISQSWRNLSDADRLDWNAAALSFPKINKYGDTYIPSGFQLWMEGQLNRAKCGKSVGGDTPTAALYPDISDIAITSFTSSLIELSWSIPGTIGYYLVVYSSRGMSPGVGSNNKGYGFIWSFSVNGITSFDITSKFIDRYGVPISNQKYFFRFSLIKIDGGQSSLFSYLSVIAP